MINQISQKNKERGFNMDIKAIALDMDGTLLDSNGEVSADLINEINRLQMNGLKVFIATGRTQKEISDVLPSNIRPDGYVTANGMGVYTEKKRLTQYSLDEYLLHIVVREARASNIYYEVHPLEGSRIALKTDKEYFFNELDKAIPETLLENEWNSRKAALKNKINWVHNLEMKQIVKVYFFSMDTKKINDWKQRLDELKKEIDFTTASSSLHNVEIMVSNVSKGTGVQLLLEEYGIPNENLMVIGDGENDLPMFRIAGYAVAMKNAEKNVQAQANEVTNFTYEQSGLYHYLKNLQLNI